MSNKIELNIFKCGQYKWRNPLKRLWFNFRNYFRQLKWAYQRATRGYSDWDLWDLDSFYTQILINSLRDFAQKTNGHPGEMTFEEWQILINTIANCFEESQEDLEDNLESWKRMEQIRQKYVDTNNSKNNDIDLLLKDPEDDLEFQKARKDWVTDLQQITKHRKEMSDRGFDLLKEWIWHLWF